MCSHHRARERKRFQWDKGKWHNEAIISLHLYCWLFHQFQSFKIRIYDDTILFTYISHAQNPAWLMSCLTTSWTTQLSMLLGLHVSVVACFLPCLFYSFMFEFSGPVETSLEISHKGSPYSVQWGRGEKHGPAGSHYPTGKIMSNTENNWSWRRIHVTDMNAFTFNWDNFTFK